MPKRRFCAALQRYAPSILMLAVFETVGVALWLAKGNLFYLGNFSYIGASIALGLFLFERKARWARRVVQFLVGAYMLVFLGLYRRENMQIEGFWYYLFLGVFEAATIHYAVAKILARCFLAAAGAAMPAGRPWCWICCPIAARKGRTSPAWAACAMPCSPFRCSLCARSSFCSIPPRWSLRCSPVSSRGTLFITLPALALPSRSKTTARFANTFVP